MQGMAHRDGFKLDVTCPNCGLRGEASASEDDHALMRDPGFKVDELPEGFSLVSAATWYRQDVLIQCGRCGVKFKPWTSG
jgi:hypothetical protein